MQTKKKVLSTDLYEYHYPHDVNCSPDGKYAAFLMSHMDKSADGYIHDIQLLNTETKEIRRPEQQMFICHCCRLHGAVPLRCEIAGIP